MPYILDKDCPVWQKHNPLCGGKYWHYCQIIPDKEKELEEKTKRQKEQLKQVYKENNELKTKLTQSLEKNKKLEKDNSELKEQLEKITKENKRLLGEVGKLSVEVDNKKKEIETFQKKQKETELDLKKTSDSKSDISDVISEQENTAPSVKDEENLFYSESEGESEGEGGTVSDASSGISNTNFDSNKWPKWIFDEQELVKRMKNTKDIGFETLLAEIADPNKKLEDLPLDFVDTRQREMGIFFSPKKQQILLKELKKRRKDFKQKKKQT